ncbi:MAG: electron transfer flavoprotein subunit beta/FixA family protein [Deltaproteobacteria bacterium]|nr:electron transfer flavoprotein subunit beta/FixA family protein [Deltaproteobacteria bacterium]
MRIVVCVKEVLDPDAVNNYAVAGRLEIGDDGKTLTQTAIPRLMNGFDEQAIEAALRLRDAGADFTLAVISAGESPEKLLKHAAALGADEVVAIQVDPGHLDYHAVAALISAQIEASGGADVVLCGRQASDDDQGVVPALIAERLDMSLVTIAKAVELEGTTLRITRVTPDGDERVETACPAVVTITNELGDPRYPTAAAKVKARRVKPTTVTPDDLKLDADDLAPRVSVTRQFVPEVQGNCEMLQGDSPAALADALIEKLRADSII